MPSSKACVPKLPPSGQPHMLSAKCQLLNATYLPSLLTICPLYRLLRRRGINRFRTLHFRLRIQETAPITGRGWSRPHGILRLVLS